MRKLKPAAQSLSSKCFENPMGKTKGVLWRDGGDPRTTTRKYLMLLTVRLQMAKMANFTSGIHHNKNKIQKNSV